ncbi:MAG: hypothetical protein IJ418_16840 [Clostridia bacterium]|nr:hypothetical protein [Clostridia bacterium]
MAIAKILTAADKRNKLVLSGAVTGKAKEKCLDAASADGDCGGKCMTEQQVKSLCKWAVENGERRLTDEEKELIKQAIDEAENIEELFAVAFATALIG